jgi:CheY-like chemotaxis protein
MADNTSDPKDLSRLIRKFTHDLGNLLVAVVGNGELLLEEGDLPEEARLALKEMVDGAVQASDLNYEFQRRFSGMGNAPKSVSETGGRAVLVVDDQEVVRSLGQTILGKEGYQVITASSALEAIAQFERHKDQLLCVLLDLTLPDASPRELLRRLGSARPQVALYAMSANPHEEAEDLQRAVDAVLQKPFFAEDLVNLVKSGRTSSEAERENREMAHT